MRCSFDLRTVALGGTLGWMAMIAPLVAAAAEPPTVRFAFPPVLKAGEKARITFRGHHLKDLQSAKVTVGDAAGQAVEGCTLAHKGGAGVPNRHDAAEVGDTEAAVEVPVPTTGADRLSFVLTSADGSTKPLTLPILPADKVLEEKEGNDGFREAQELPIGQTVRGVIHQEQNVDVYRVAAAAGQKVTLRLIWTGPLDPMLQLFDDRGNILTIAESAAEPGQAISCTLAMPTEGVIFAALLDSLDRGSGLHHYSLHADLAR